MNTNLYCLGKVSVQGCIALGREVQWAPVLATQADSRELSGLNLEELSFFLFLDSFLIYVYAYPCECRGQKVVSQTHWRWSYNLSHVGAGS